MQGVEHPKFWGHRQGHEADNVNYVTYLSNLTAVEILDRGIAVTGGATVGAWAGMAIGCAAGGVGAIPGVAIGAGIGAAVGFVGANAYDVTTYLGSFTDTLTKEGKKSVELILGQVMDDAGDVCAISRMVARDPVMIRGEPGAIYERKELLAYMEMCKKKEKPITSPLTRKQFSREDIQISYEQVAKLGKRTDQLLNNDVLRRQLQPEQLKGLELLRRDTIKTADKFFTKETDAVMKAAKTKKISPREMAMRVAQLADILDPVIGDEATTARVEVDVEAIEIPPALLLKNAKPKVQHQEERKFNEADDV